jgi:DNA/RNA-binding domain of Phe-tRNA-synthetase-like protein
MHLGQLQLSESLQDIARVGVVFFRELACGAGSAALKQRIESFAADLRQSVGDRCLLDLDPVRRTRDLYHALGVDPTKDRPASERLLRRVLQSGSFPFSNSLADAVSFASLSLLCPLGAYDWDSLVPPVLVRIGRPEESFVTAHGDTFRLDGKIVLVDGEGLFGNPSHDSARTQVTPRTVRAMVVAWAGSDTPRSTLENVLQEVITLGKEYCGARVSESGILG